MSRDQLTKGFGDEGRAGKWPKICSGRTRKEIELIRFRSIRPCLRYDSSPALLEFPTILAATKSRLIREAQPTGPGTLHEAESRLSDENLSTKPRCVSKRARGILETFEPTTLEPL